MAQLGHYHYSMATRHFDTDCAEQIVRSICACAECNLNRPMDTGAPVFGVRPGISYAQFGDVLCRPYIPDDPYDSDMELKIFGNGDETLFAHDSRLTYFDTRRTQQQQQRLLLRKRNRIPVWDLYHTCLGRHTPLR